MMCNRRTSPVMDTAMTALVLTSDNHRALKRALIRALPRCGSSHLSEALASALGFGSNAALLVRVEQMTCEAFPEFALLDESAFKKRLADLGYDVDRIIEPKMFNKIGMSEDGSILVKTEPSSAAKIKYRAMRHRAWRNIMVAAINAALEQKLLSLKPGDNRWPGASRKDTRGLTEGYVFRFIFGNSIPAVGYIGDAGFDEISIHAALWPTEEGEHRVAAYNVGFRAGEAFAQGWLERLKGAWLQSSNTLFSCRKARVTMIAETSVVPRGFGDRGHVIV
jgi:hypothetical protein